MIGLAGADALKIERILHVVPALFDPHDGGVGGAERYALELARHMGDAVPTSLVTFGKRQREERIGNLTITVIGKPWLVRGQRSNPFALALLPHVARADVVHCHQQHVLASTMAALTARALGRRVFCTDHGGGGWDISAYASTDRLYHGHLHISEYSRTIAGHAGQPWAHVILGGVDTTRFCPLPPFGAGGPALFVGRILPHKGVDVFIRGLRPEMQAQVIGPCVDLRYRAHLDAAALGKSVTFRHDCDDLALLDAYRQACCIVLPSVYRDIHGKETQVPELLGQTLLEGMACGLPAVCTKVASLPEVVEDRVTGFVVPPNNPSSLGAALERLAAHPDQARAMGQAGRLRVLERFQWSTVVRRCLDIYGAKSVPSLVTAARQTAAI